MNHWTRNPCILYAVKYSTGSSKDTVWSRCSSQGNMVFTFPPFFFLHLLHFLLPFILFHLFPAAFSLPPWLTLPPLWDHYIVELYLSASLLIFSTKGTLANSLCLLLLIHNYLPSHRRTRCTSLISWLLLPPLLMHKGLIWLSVQSLINN